MLRITCSGSVPTNLPVSLPSDPIPDGWILPPGASGGLTASAGLHGNGPVASVMRTPFSQQWNLTIARQFGPRTALEVDYAGNKGTDVPFRHGSQTDQLPPEHINPESGIL